LPDFADHLPSPYRLYLLTDIINIATRTQISGFCVAIKCPIRDVNAQQLGIIVSVFFDLVRRKP